jgi:hypothetical protein
VVLTTHKHSQYTQTLTIHAHAGTCRALVASLINPHTHTHTYLHTYLLTYIHTDIYAH